MKLILTIAFNSLINSQIKIDKPSFVPNVGDIVDIVPEDYLSDISEINTLKEYAANDIWKVGFKTITYEKNKTSILIVLFEEKHFNEHHKNII